MPYFRPLRTYQAVDEVVDAFSKRLLTFLLIIGNPGVGKTGRFRRQLGDNALIIDCTASPFGVYCELGRRPDCDFVVLDDIDGLLSDRRGVTLLKSLGQTEVEKVVSWHTQAAGREGLPRRLDLHCRVMMLANEAKGRGANFEAVMDRAHCYEFLPTADEVHRQVGGWIERGEAGAGVERDVFDFIGRNLALIPRPSFRHYVKASEGARAGLDWQGDLVTLWTEDPKLAAVAEIMRRAEAGDPTLATAEQRVQRFREWGHGSRSTFMG